MSTEIQCLLITKTFSLKGRDPLGHWLNVFGAWGSNRVKGANIPGFLLSWLSLIIIKLLRNIMLKAKECQFVDAPLSTSVLILLACLIAAQVALSGDMGLEAAVPSTDSGRP